MEPGTYTVRRSMEARTTSGRCTNSRSSNKAAGQRAFRDCRRLGKSLECRHGSRGAELLNVVRRTLEYRRLKLENRALQAQVAKLRGSLLGSSRGRRRYVIS